MCIKSWRVVNKMGRCMKSLSLLLTIMLVFEGGKAKKTVQIINNLSNKQELTFHCKSKNDDLGIHTIKSGQTYSFSFNPCFFCTTLFFCSFAWPSDPSSHYFDIFDDHRDWCDNVCARKITESGPCTIDEYNHNVDKCYPWNHKP